MNILGRHGAGHLEGCQQQRNTRSWVSEVTTSVEQICSQIDQINEPQRDLRMMITNTAQAAAKRKTGLPNLLSRASTVAHWARQKEVENSVLARTDTTKMSSVRRSILSAFRNDSPVSMFNPLKSWTSGEDMSSSLLYSDDCTRKLVWPYSLTGLRYPVCSAVTASYVFALEQECVIRKVTIQPAST